MATTKNGIYYQNNYDAAADVLEDMKKMAESIDGIVEENNNTQIQQNANIEQINGAVSNLFQGTNSMMGMIRDIQQKDIEQDTNIQSLQQEISELEEDVKANSIIVTTEEATSLQVNDANGARAKLSVKGNYRQKTREGYNLLNVEKNFTVTKGFVSVPINLKANTNYTVKADDIITDDTKEYATFIFKDASDSDVKWVSLHYDDKKTTFTLSEDVTQVSIYSSTNYPNSQSATTTFKNLMIYEGTEEKDYEEYGKAPTREFSAEIETVKDEVSIKKVNKNYLKIADQIVTNSGITLKIEDGKHYLSGENTGSSTVLELTTNVTLKPGTYTMSTNSNSAYPYLQLRDANNNVVGEDMVYSDNGVKTFTLKEEKTVAKARLYFGSSKSANELALQIELGSTKTDFEENKEENYSLDIQQEMLKDDYFDLEKNKEVHHWKGLELTGDEAWRYEAHVEGKKTIIMKMTIDPALDMNSGVCTHFDYIGDYSLDEEHCYAGMSGTLFVFVDYSVISTVEEFKAYLKAQKTAGTPVKVYYKTAETTELDLTETQIEQSEQLNKLRTYKEQTNIVTVEDLALMQLEYSQDLKAYIDSKIGG